MKLVADERSRIASSVLFKPHTVHHTEKGEDGRIILVEMAPAEVPMGRSRRIKGRLRGAEMDLRGDEGFKVVSPSEL